MFTSRVVVFVCMCLCSVASERILAVFPLLSKSHHMFFASVLEALAERGHDVIVVSQFPRSVPLPRYTDIDVSHIATRRFVLNLTEYETISMKPQLLTEIIEVVESFEKVYHDKQVMHLVNSTKFDLLITEIFASDMFVGLAHVLNVPIVGMISSVVTPWATNRFAIPDNPSYIRTYLSYGAGPMDLLERIVNCYQSVPTKFVYGYFITPNDERVCKQYLGKDVPHVEDIVKKTSLLLLNSHFSINGARAFPPQVVEVGGVHIKAAKPLIQEIERFLNESEHGVIYFSLGSIANVSSMSDRVRNAFCNSFAKLKQRVLWKWETEDMPNKPDNVKLVKWMPQADVLVHPKVKVFIGHGGLLGTMEGVYNAVPMIGIPLFADQYQNIANLVNAGSAVLLDFKSISEATVTKALDTILTDPNYKQSALHLSKLFRDRPTSPLDTAVYWIEYVMKHKGAHHLRSAAVDLPWYQYLLLDVAAAIILAFAITLTILVCTVKYILKIFKSKSKEKLQ